MKKIRQATICLSVAVLLLSLFPFLTPDALAAPDPEVLAEAAIVVEKNTGTVLYSKNENQSVYPASVTKIMTVMLAIEACDQLKISLDDVVTASETAFEGLEDDGSTAGIVPGEEIVLKDLLYCAMLVSANEACNIIAEHVSGDISSFVSLMNARAIELGCSGTHFSNTHGLPDENHYTTAYDLYLITATAMSNPAFSEIIGTSKYVIPETNVSDERTFVNTNRLIIPGDQYFYEYAAGGKTGYTSAAGFCLVSCAEKDDLELISVIMNAKSIVLEDGTTQTQTFTETKRLFEWCFDNFSYRTILSTLDLLADVPVALGNGADSVILRPASSVTALLDNSIDLDTTKLDIVIYNERDGTELKAPIHQGDELGEVTVTLDGKNYGTIKLVANTTIDLKHSEYLKSEIKSFFSNRYVKITIISLIVLAGLYIFFVINYNIKRSRKRRIETELAKKKIEEIRRSSASTIGKSFEEIESIHKNNQYK